MVKMWWYELTSGVHDKLFSGAKCFLWSVILSTSAKEMKFKNISQACKIPLSVPTKTKIVVSDVMDAGYMLFLLFLVTACIN